MLRGQKLKKYDSPQEQGILKFSGTGSGNAATDQITFELDGLWKDALQQRLLKQIQAKIERDFGDEKGYIQPESAVCV